MINSQPQHQKKVTLYRNLVEPMGTLSIRTIIDVIRSDRFKPFQQVIQDYLAGGNKEQANAEKKKLFSFSASCQCSLWRNLENVTIYTSYIIFDIDGLTETEAKGMMLLLSAEPYVMAAFRSPSWKGVKFIIETDSPVQDHKYAYDQAAIYYERLLGRKIDRSGSDICRLCFIGHDPLAFYKEHSIFKIMLPSTCPGITPNPKTRTEPYMQKAQLLRGLRPSLPFGALALSKKIKELEKLTSDRFDDHDKKFQLIFEAIRQLINPPNPPRKRIGFKVGK